jgi:NAD(P)-dependent dehydrogenase (short-subunit alcohol dehydrogenase family)
MATLDPFPGLSAYAASKSALESLTRSIQIEGRAHGIRAFTVAPGAVETEMLRQVVSKEDLSPQRAHDPMDVARVIGECVSGRRDVEMGKTICLPNQ